nr:prepilin peptidase [Gammaproteobacteria bacterium]
MNLELSILLTLFALSVGSFVNTFIYRFPLIDSNENLDLLKPRSFCPKCKSRLKPFMLIPIISYIYLKGTCSFCKEKIGISYPLNEVIHLLTMIAILFSVPIGINSIIIFVLFSILYTQMVLDYKHFLLSISLNVLLIVAGLVLNYGFNYFTSFEESLLGIIIGYGSLWLINAVFHWLKKEQGIGGGDFLLFAGCGSIFGLFSLGPILLMGSSASLLLFALNKRKYG